jgi:hypothetical protein
MNSLTSRFGRIHTPTALERFSSGVSPEPSTPQPVVHTITLQAAESAQPVPAAALPSPLFDAPPSDADGVASVMYEADDDEEVAASSVGSMVGLSPAWPTQTHGRSFSPDEPESPLVLSLTGSTISVMSSLTDEVQVVQVPMRTSSGDGSDSVQTITAVHIYHHHSHMISPASGAEADGLPPGSPMLSVDGSSSQMGSPSASPSRHGTPSLAVSSHPPTVVTINSTVATKAPPAYEDDAQMEQDLLHVQRYKIAANKAIPV